VERDKESQEAIKSQKAGKTAFKPLSKGIIRHFIT
jgi:hypothetical protein